jgi:MSHA biogenesis protein MshP
MCPDRITLHTQTGFSLPLAIVLLVVVSLLAAAIFRMNTINQQSTVQEVISARAFLAAESGAQAQMMRIFPLSGAANCAAQSLTLSGAGFNGCTVTTSCNSITIGTQVFYDIESSGRCVAANISAQRTVQIQAKNL